MIYIVFCLRVCTFGCIIYSPKHSSDFIKAAMYINYTGSLVMRVKSTQHRNIKIN